MQHENEKRNKIIRLLDGMRYALRLLEYNQQSLYNACLLIKKNKPDLIPALSHCWQIIDMTHRIREMSQAIPTLSNDNRCLKTFLSNTKSAENFRHYIQHLRTELLHSKHGKFPVFGSLSWVDNTDNRKCHIAIMGSQLNGIKHFGLTSNRQDKRFVGRVELSLGNEPYNFDLAYETILKFQKFIMPYLDKRSGLHKTEKEDIVIFTHQI